MKKTLLLLCTFLCSLGMWAEDLVVTYDFSVAANYPTGFPTSNANTCTTETGYVFNGNTIYFKTANSGSLYQASVGTGSSKVYSVFLGKNIKYNASSANTIASTAYMKIPGKTGYKITKIVVNNASNAATSSINLAVCNADYQMVIPAAVASSTTDAMTFNINSTGTMLSENEAAYFCMAPTVASGKNLNVKKIVVTYTETEVATPYTVTFNAGSNGTCSTPTLTESAAGAGVTLPSCTPNSGYAFLGWSATEGKTTIDTGLAAGATYKPSAATTLYAVYGALYQVNIENPTNGTLSVKYGDNDVTSGEYYAVGQDINIVATPSAGYKFRNIQVVDATTHTFTTSNEKVWTMGKSDITIKANFDEIINRTITWSVNGNTTTIDPTQVEDGANITFPTGLADIYGKKFMGWSAKEDASSATDLVSGDVAASADATYYAVFADVTPGSEEIATLAITDNATVSYTNGLKRTDNQGNEWVSYACITSQSVNNKNVYYIQINKNSNGYYIGSPDFSGNVKSISAKAWNTSNSVRSAYLKSNTETKQPSTSDYGTTEIAANSKGVDINFSINNNAEFSQFYIYSSGAIGFESITVTYGEDDVIENYTTKPVPTFASLDDLIAADQSFEAVNVKIDDKVFAAVAKDGKYLVLLTNSQVTLASSDEGLGWLAGGTVTGTLTNVSWDNENGLLMSQEPFWSALSYTAPEIQEFASIDELLAAGLAHGTTVTVTVKGTITEVREVEGDGAYVVVLNNTFSIGSPSSELNWEVGGTVSGKLESVIFGTDEGETGVVSVSENLFEILTYTAPAEPTTATITLNAACTDGEMVYGTYSNEKAFVVSDDIIVYEIMLVDGAIMKEAYKTSDVVPANTGVLVAANEAGNYEVELADEELASIAESVLGNENALRASGAGITAADMEEDGDNYYYRLTMQNGSKIGFWWGATDGAAFDLDANKAYLVAPKSEGAAKGFAFGGTPTIIDAINAAQKVNGVAYNLNGQRVAANAKGIVIINGNKYINK